MPRYKTERCDWKRPRDGKLCLNEATFLVGIGTRKFDRQKACSRHVAATVILMIGQDGEHGFDKPVDYTKAATITWHPKGIKKREETSGNKPE